MTSGAIVDGTRSAETEGLRCLSTAKRGAGTAIAQMPSPLTTYCDNLIERQDGWAQINAQPRKAPAAWTLSGGRPVERCPIIGPTVRLQSQPPCTVCGNHGQYQCDCDEEAHND